MIIFLNLLASSNGGQLTRAEEFLKRLNEFEASFIILKEKNSFNKINIDKKHKIVSFDLGDGKFRILKRFFVEIFYLPVILLKYKCHFFLTFSHFLPFFIFSKSIVGVSNLAPFSEIAWKEENLLSKLRLFVLKKLIVSSCSRANLVLALSNTCRLILEKNNINNEKIFVAPNGVSRFWEIENGEQDKLILDNLKISKKYLLCVSHFHFYKNYKRVVCAYSNLSDKIKRNYSLILVGSLKNQPCFTEVNDLIKQLNLTKKIFIIDNLPKEKLRTLYQNCSLFIFPSLIENSPNILLEAMKSKAPILSSNFYPMPEFGGNAAEYFNGLDTNELKIKINDLINDETKIKNMKLKSRIQSSRYSWDDFVMKIKIKIKSLNDLKS